MKLEKQYKHLMDQIQPEKMLQVADLTEYRNAENDRPDREDLKAGLRKKKAGAGPVIWRYAAVLIPAAMIVLLALFLPDGLLRGKTDNGKPAQQEADVQITEHPSAAAEAANSKDGSLVTDESAEDTDESLADETDEVLADDGTEGGIRTGGIIVAENKMQAVGNVRLYFEQMEKDLEENTIQAFLAKYPETGEAYRDYYDHLHSTNPWHVAEMVYAWITPGHPELADGDYLVVGCRVKTDIQGPYDSLNDAEHPDEGPDMSGFEFHGWSYQLNYLYHLDEASGTLTPVEFPGRQLYLCRDYTFSSEGHDTEYTVEDGRVLKNEEIFPYMDETDGYTIPLSSYRQTQTEYFFTFDEAGALLLEGAFTVMDIRMDWKTGEETDLLSQEAASQARNGSDELMILHGRMESVLEEADEFVPWQVLEETGK